MLNSDVRYQESHFRISQSMGVFRKAAFFLSLAIMVSYFLRGRDDQLPEIFSGFVKPGFESVEKAFRQNFHGGYEPDGASFAVCHRGEIVVDLWGGYADTFALREWEEDTLTTVFSTTKGASAIVMAMLVDRGLLSYDDLVIKYWPEFGAHGKDEVTVKMLIGHEAGLAALDREITVETLKDWRVMSKMFEDQIPNWPPGTGAGYHAITFGQLCDQLVRRVDPQHRSLGQYFRDEIAIPFDIDFYIGLPRDQHYRTTRMVPASFWDVLKRLDDWPYVQFLMKMIFAKRSPVMEKMMGNPKFFNPGYGRFAFNNPELKEIEMPAGNGIGTARALARLFCLLDGSRLLNKTIVQKVLKPVRYTPEDLAIGMNVTWGWGFMHTLSPEGTIQIGHPGFGGQNVKFDPQEHLAFAYVRNNLSPDMGELTRTFRNLQHELYESIRALKK